MINKNDFKYIIKKIIIGLAIAFILFNINKCNASAMVWKGTEFTQFESGATFSGYINGYNTNSDSKTLESVFVDPISTEGYDWLVFPFYEFNFTEDESGTISNLSDSDFYCDSFQLSSQYYENTGNYLYSNLTCTHVTSTNTLNSSSFSLTEGSISFSAQVFNTNGNASLCYFNKNENQIYCPTNQLDNIKRLVLYVKAYNFRGNYKLTYYRLKQKYNNDSTEIVNGLGGVQQQQQQTNTIISDNNISGANTATNNALSGINNSVSNTLDNSINANTLNTLLTGFVNQLSNTTCTPITLPIPFTNENIVLPCLGTEFSQRIPVIWSLYELIITGVLVLRFWQHAVEFILNVLDPYHIGANNIPTGGGK